MTISKKTLQNLTFTRSASDSGRAETSLFSSWVTKSITGSGSINAVEDISSYPKEIFRLQKCILHNRLTKINKELKRYTNSGVTYQYSKTNPSELDEYSGRNLASSPIPHLKAVFCPGRVNKMIFLQDNTYNIKNPVSKEVTTW